MTTDSLRLAAMKKRVVQAMFTDMADQDYLAARLAYGAEMFNLFFWSAGQAIEKYLKASLLLNGLSAKGYGHNLEKLFADVCEYASDLFPEKLSKPEGLEVDSLFEWDIWPDESPAQFVKRFNSYANANIRYNAFPFAVHTRDLFGLDQFVFHARRAAMSLDDHPLKRVPKDWRELLKESSGFQPHRTDFNKPLEKLRGKDMYEAALSWNFPLAPKDYPHENSPIRSVIYTPFYAMAILGAEEQDSDGTEMADLADWIVSNIELPKNLKRELRKQAAALRGAQAEEDKEAGASPQTAQNPNASTKGDTP